MNGWFVSHGTPTLFGNDSPSNANGCSIWMWSYSSNGEGVFTCYDFQAGQDYDLCLWVRNTNNVSNGGHLQIWMVSGFTEYGNGGSLPPSSIAGGQLIDSTFTNDSSWVQLTYTITPAANFTELVIYPFMSAPPVGGAFQYELQIDDVRVSPISSAGGSTLSITATDVEIGWCDSTQLCAAGVSPGTMITWSPATGLSATTGDCVMASPCEPTTYFASIPGAAACPNACTPTIGSVGDSVLIDVRPPTVILTTSAPLICGEPAWLAAQLPDPLCASSYQWIGPDGAATASDSILIADLDAGLSGAYVFELVHPNGSCTATSNVITLLPQGTTALLFVPNAFSPNGDGINDRFLAYARGFTRYDLKIFDRWGELIHRTTNAGEGWNGVSGDGLVQNDVFAYVLDYALECSGKSEKAMGHVTVVR